METQKPFSLLNALKAGVNTYIQNIGFFVSIAIVFDGLFYALSLLVGFISFDDIRNCLAQGDLTCLFKSRSLPTLLAFIMFSEVAGSYYHYQILRFGLKLSKVQTFRWTDLFTTDGTFGTFFHARLLYFLRNALWSILLIIPGIYQATVYFFTGYSLVDSRTKTVFEDQKFARSLSVGIRWPLLLLVVPNFLFTNSLLRLVIIMLLQPIMMLAGVNAYEQQINALSNPSNDDIDSLPIDQNQQPG